jgi:hypothetical protein
MGYVLVLNTGWTVSAVVVVVMIMMMMMMLFPM